MRRDAACHSPCANGGHRGRSEKREYRPSRRSASSRISSRASSSILVGLPPLTPVVGSLPAPAPTGRDSIAQGAQPWVAWNRQPESPNGARFPGRSTAMPQSLAKVVYTSSNKIEIGERTNFESHGCRGKTDEGTARQLRRHFCDPWDGLAVRGLSLCRWDLASEQDHSKAMQVNDLRPIRQYFGLCAPVRTAAGVSLESLRLSRWARPHAFLILRPMSRRSHATFQS